MNWINRNKLYIGVIFGLILTILTYTLLRVMYEWRISLPPEADPVRQQWVLERFSILGNLGAFYFFLNRGHYNSVRGVLIITFVLALSYAIIYFNI